MRSPIRVVQLVGQQWFQFLCVFDGFTHRFTQLVNSILLLLQTFLQIFVRGRSGQTLLLIFRFYFFQLIRNLFLLLFNIASFVTHLLHTLIELAGSAILKFISQFFQVA